MALKYMYLFIAFVSSSVITQAQDTFQFIKQNTYGTTNDVIVGEFESFTVDDLGQVFIADMDLNTIHVFNADGTFKQDMGRQGEGPAEFSTIASRTFITTKDERFYITDYPSDITYFPDRMQIFSATNFSFIKTVKLIPDNRADYIDSITGYSPFQVFPFNEKRYLVSYRKSPITYRTQNSDIRYFVVNRESEIVDGPILIQNDVKNLEVKNTGVVDGKVVTLTTTTTFPFLSKALITVSENGRIYTANTKEFEIQIRNSSAEHLSTISQQMKAKPIDREELLQEFKGYGEALSDDDAVIMIKEAENLPEYWPVLNDLLVDDEERIWVSTFTEDHSVFEWQVLNEKGDIISKFLWPKDKPIQIIKNGYIYTKELDEDGFDQVVKYKILGL